MTELQLQLHQMIDTITDKRKLTAIYELLSKSTDRLSPMTLEEYVNAINESQQQLKEGRFINVKDLEKEAKNW